MVVDGGIMTRLICQLLHLPRVALLVMHEAGEVIALVEILEDRREDLRLFVGQGDLLRLGVKHLVLKDVEEEG